MTVLEADKAAIRQRLLAEEARTVEQIELLDERGREMQPPGEVAFSTTETLQDESMLAIEREKDLTLRRSLQGVLLHVRSALLKLERGSYGACDSCGQPIAPARLQVLPYSALCITCQTKAERRRS